MRSSSTPLLLFCFIGVTSSCGGKGENTDADSQGGGSPAAMAGGSGPSGGEASGGAAAGGAAGGATPTSGGAGGLNGSGGDPLGSGGGPSGDGGSASQGCSFSVITNEISPGMATVGIIEWTLDAVPTDAKLVYTQVGASPDQLNRGGEATVDLTRENFRTLLLGLKQTANYTFLIEATVEGETCVSETYTLPTTGMLDTAPTFSVDVTAASAREPGFIVATSGYTGNTTNEGRAFIIDADGEIVWAASAPPDACRAKMDYEGENMWMQAVNFAGGAGEMRTLSMDGLIEQKDIEGLANAHHDFTVMPGGKVATMAWTDFVIEPESDLLIRFPDGTIETAFRIGANLYASPEDRYHANALHYNAEDDSFTISDRNPDLFVKVSAGGELLWQLGGSCQGAPAGPDKCSAQTWMLNHGHHLLSDGSFLLFTNTGWGNEVSWVAEFDITATETSMSATLVKEYEGTTRSGILGDVQRLPGGNTLITYSDDAQIVEVDADWQVVQTFSGAVGYADFRPTLYGPPARL